MDLRSSWARQLVTLPWVSLSLRVPDSRHGLDVGNASTLPKESGSQRANYRSTQNTLAASNAVMANELISVAREFDATGGAAGRRDPEAGEGAAPEGSLADFLEQVSVVADADQVPEGENHGGVVTPMTLDTAKGLKFPVVFLTGLEENAFPYQRSVGDDEEIEEERLAYVGITRAEGRLYLTRALARTWWGWPECQAQSRFLAEVPESLIEWRRDQNAPAAAVAPASQRLARRPGVR
jgi:DNA helicase-2/ATP-dependent DNA helicase PcrA